MIANFFIRLVLSLAGVVAMILGAHGLVVYFMGEEALFKDPRDLFLAVQVPGAFQSPIEWMSFRGVDSWVIPAIFVALALVLWFVQGRIRVAKNQAAAPPAPPAPQ